MTGDREEMERAAEERERARQVKRRAWTITARKPPLDYRVRLQVRQTAGAPLTLDESVVAVEAGRLGELEEAVHEMRVALLRIAEADLPEGAASTEVLALARTGATWG